jgi:putative flippase GtrA
MFMAIARLLKDDRIRYLIAGGYNTAFGYYVFALLYEIMGHQVNYVVVLLLSHVESVTSAYFVYALFVFHHAARGISAYLRFNLVYVGVLGINIVALPFLVEWFKLNVLFSQALITVITVVCSFVMHKTFTFRKRNK